MTATKLRWTTGICLLGCFFSSVAFGCRYSVRDVGFVDLGSAPYRLYGYIREDTPEELTTAFRQISYAALIDSNIEVSIVDADREKDHPALKYLHFREIKSFPAAILISPDGQSFVLPISLPNKPFKETLWSALDSVVSSPKREEIFQHIVRAYCVVLLIQGSDAAENKRAEEEAVGAIDTIARIMNQMPKPIEDPPYFIVIPPESRLQERILLWSLGVDEQEVSEPHIAVLFGRGRRIGPLLVGEEIMGRRLLNILYVIGQSCECGLDRRWMQGTMIPLRWDSKIQSEVVEVLGFDAESPMVKTEISQILFMGPSVRGEAGGPSGFSLGGFEYSEEIVEFEDEPSVAMISPAQFRDLSSPAPASAEENSIFQMIFLISGGMALLILAGGALILLRARWR